jgi:hypothetical protein
MAGSGFNTPVDICNQALQLCGVRRITTFSDGTVNSNAVANAYDNCRRFELRRNVWGHSVRRAVLRPVSLESLLFAPTAWDVGTTYPLGQLVTNTYGTGTAIWQSTVAGNVGNEPSETSIQWGLYFGPVNYEPYDSSLGYYAGDVTYIPATWASGTTYAAGAVVTYNSLPYLSLVGSNLNHEPDTNPTDWAVQKWPLVYSSTLAQWNANTFYNVGLFVQFGGGIYYALQATTGNIPSTSPTFWALVVQQGPVAYVSLASNNSSVPAADTNWLQLSGTLTAYAPLYPVGAGPQNDSSTRNVFLLPEGYLNEAPQDPKAGSTNYLGAPTGRFYSDWEIENDMIVSRDPSPIILRFAADVVNVSKFDSLFCMGLAASIAEIICEEVTQSVAKLQSIRAEYGRRMTEARVINGIEQGPTEPPLDDYITCRI